MSEKYELTTKSGFKFTVSFSDEPPDFNRLASFITLLSETPQNKTTKRRHND